MAAASEWTLVTEVTQRLAAKYKHVPPEQVAEVVRTVHDSFAKCRVRDFVPLLVERRAAAELTKAGRRVGEPA